MYKRIWKLNEEALWYGRRTLSQELEDPGIFCVCCPQICPENYIEPLHFLDLSLPFGNITRCNYHYISIRSHSVQNVTCAFKHFQTTQRMRFLWCITGVFRMEEMGYSRRKIELGDGLYTWWSFKLYEHHCFSSIKQGDSQMVTSMSCSSLSRIVKEISVNLFQTVKGFQVYYPSLAFMVMHKLSKPLQIEKSWKVIFHKYTS